MGSLLELQKQQLEEQHPQQLQLQEQLHQFLVQQQILQLMNIKLSGNAKKGVSLYYLVNMITKFKYKSDEGATFETYCRKYKHIFKQESKDWDDNIKTHLILEKLVHKHYNRSI